MNRFICIHGHFYQPPRENPWLEAIELQDSAYPFHDWNDRITAECYRPNATARILDGSGWIEAIVNNYSRISFNFGPTLLAWLEPHAPDVYRAILEADAESRRRYAGHGSAIAQAYNHMILPLATRRDKVTQVRWGIADFVRRFGRRPDGMWLPETAADLESLEVLREHGIRFTILAPHQAARVRGLGEKEWRDVSGGKVDPSMPYWVELPSGGRIAVYFYDGPISRAVAFERLLVDGAHFARRLASGFDESRRRPQLVHLATDGETYGHHHRHGDMGLAYALHEIEARGLAKLTNYAEHLERHPPTHVAEIHERTAWSCAHGVGRWERDCGCRAGGGDGWTQAWRGPLRAALDWLRDDLEPRFARLGSELFASPWEARDDYIDVVLDRSRENVDRFLARHARRHLSDAEATSALRLLELTRHAQLMYTSCGWFFDERSGIETVQVIQYAGRALQLAEELFGDGIEAPFLARLERARSNLPERGDGRRIYDELVRPARVNLLKVGAHYAVSSLLDPRHAARTRMFCYEVDRPDLRVFEAGRVRLAVGRAVVSSLLTRESDELTYAVLHLGEHNVSGGVRRFRGEAQYAEMVKTLGQTFGRGDLAETLRLVDESMGGPRRAPPGAGGAGGARGRGPVDDEGIYSLKSLFRDEQRRLVDTLLAGVVLDVQSVYRGVFERNAPLMRYLASIGVPPPRALLAASEMILSADLRRAAETRPLDIERLGQLLDEARQQSVPIDGAGVAYALSQNLASTAHQLGARPTDGQLLARLDEGVSFAVTFPWEIDLARAQNVYHELAGAVYPRQSRRADDGDEAARSWVALFRALGDKLRVKLPPPAAPPD